MSAPLEVIFFNAVQVPKKDSSDTNTIKKLLPIPARAEIAIKNNAPAKLDKIVAETLVFNFQNIGS